jgi:hypothetical protein
VADPQTFSVDIPEEPPDMSVVAGREGDRDGAGTAWMRNDPPLNKGDGVWWPAGPVYLTKGGEASTTSLSWRVLLAVYRHLTVLRWGSGVSGG